MVAVFWGANITAVYPFVEVVFQGKTLHDWIDQQIEKVEKDIERVQASVRVHAAREAGPRHLRLARGRPAGTQPSVCTHLERSKAVDQPICTPRSLPDTAGDRRVPGDRAPSSSPSFASRSLVLVGRAAGRTTADLRNEFFRSLLSDRPARNQAARRRGRACRRRHGRDWHGGPDVVRPHGPGTVENGSVPGRGRGRQLAFACLLVARLSHRQFSTADVGPFDSPCQPAHVSIKNAC